MGSEKEPWSRDYFRSVQELAKLHSLEAKRNSTISRITQSSTRADEALLQKDYDSVRVLNGLREYREFYRSTLEVLDGFLAEGLLMADMHYYCGLTQEEVGRELYYHRCTVSQRIRLLFEHLDNIGREEAFRAIRR